MLKPLLTVALALTVPVNALSLTLKDEITLKSKVKPDVYLLEITGEPACKDYLKTAGFKVEREQGKILKVYLKGPFQKRQVIEALNLGRSSGCNYRVLGGRWITSERRLKETLIREKISALKAAIEEGKVFGKALRMECTLSEVSLKPEVSGETVKIEAKLKYQCN
ncbi:hypothetical protein [Thermovibrio sp.]